MQGTGAAGARQVRPDPSQPPDLAPFHPLRLPVSPQIMRGVLAPGHGYLILQIGRGFALEWGNICLESVEAFALERGNVCFQSVEAFALGRGNVCLEIGALYAGVWGNGPWNV